MEVESENQDQESKNSDLARDTADVVSQDSTEDESEYPADGRLMSLLRKALNKTIDKCVSTARFSLYAKTHPTLAKKNAKALQCIHKQYQEKLREAIHAEVELMFREEKIVELLNELDGIIASSSVDSSPAWRPTSDADKDIRAHMIFVKFKQKEHLEKILTSLEEENSRLTKAVLPRRHSLQESQRQVREKAQNLRKVTEDLPLDKANSFLAEFSTLEKE